MKSAALDTQTGAAHAKTKQQRDRSHDMKNTEIQCPGCKTKSLVWHLNWTALSCPYCEEFFDLADWLNNAEEAK